MKNQERNKIWWTYLALDENTWFMRLTPNNILVLPRYGTAKDCVKRGQVVQVSENKVKEDSEILDLNYSLIACWTAEMISPKFGGFWSTARAPAFMARSFSASLMSPVKKITGGFGSGF